MKKAVLNFFILIFVITSVITLTACRDKSVSDCFASGSSDLYLIAGVDDASGNADVIILAGYDQVKNSAFFLHIPRDTYYSDGTYSGKINGISARALSQGGSLSLALEKLDRSINDVFGIKTSGYVGFTTESVEKIVDAIGGVDVNLNESLTYFDSVGNEKLLFPSGVNHLTGKDAVRFLRFRTGYAAADLGRIDAQKLFMSAFIKKAMQVKNARLLFSVFTNSSYGVETNCDFCDLFNIAIKNLGRIKNAEILYANLPGESAVGNDGKWYYIANKTASSSLLQILGVDGSAFDNSFRLCNSGNEGFKKIYYSNKIKFKLYNDCDLPKLKIGKKK